MLTKDFFEELLSNNNSGTARGHAVIDSERGWTLIQLVGKFDEAAKAKG